MSVLPRQGTSKLEGGTPTALRIAGIDEVGRGAWFGPVVAAALILPEEVQPLLAAWGVRDSKLLSPGKREKLSAQLQSVAIDYQIGMATVAEIDQINILQATFVAMQRAIAALNPQPHLCLVDGKQQIPHVTIPQQAIVGGDRSHLAIAAASIIAKVWRDRHIITLSSQYPEYDLAANKGYGTRKHQQALQQHGLTPEHRRSFRPCKACLPNL